MKKKRFLLLLLCSAIVLFGCARTRIIDKISIVHVFGFDEADKGELTGTALFPKYTESQGDDKIEYLDEQAQTPSLVVAKMSTHISTPVEIAKIRVLLIGKDYAEAGIEDVVKRLIMTPQLGTSIQIAASTHSAKETLNTLKKEKSLTLAEKLQHNMQGGSLPIVNLHIFLNHFYGEGMDAYVPMLTIDKKKRVSTDGLAVFKGDKLKLQLNPEQSVLFSFIKDNQIQSTYKIDLGDEHDRREMIIVRFSQSKKDWKWDQNKEQLHLRLKLQLSLTQFPDRFDVEKVEDVKEIEKIVVEDFEKGLKDLVATFKEHEVDPIGFGNIVRSKDPSWEAKSFYKKYPNMPININVDVEIVNSGLEG